VRTFAYPVYLDLVGVPVLVVGAGPIAARKVAGLVAAGAAVTVVAPTVSDAMDRASVVEVRERPFDRADLAGMRLVVTATGRADVDAAVAGAATAAGIFVNAADQPEDCSFILPAIARNGPPSVAVSTGELQARRAAVRAAGGSTEDVDWSDLIDPVLPPPPA
jgi:precorrin-2 dehydrogenase/sirohydrochlorin ferrochelatase